MSNLSQKDFNLQTGFVYVAKSTSLKLNLYKVGMTFTKSVSQRLKEEAQEMSSTFAPTDLVAMIQYPVLNPIEAEKKAHSSLKNYRFKNDPRRKEWFELDFEKLNKILEEELKPYMYSNDVDDYVSIRVDYRGISIGERGTYKHYDKVDMNISKQKYVNSFKKLDKNMKNFIQIVKDKSSSGLSTKINITSGWDFLFKNKKLIEKIYSLLANEGYTKISLYSGIYKRPIKITPKNITLGDIKKHYDMEWVYCKNCDEMTNHIRRNAKIDFSKIFVSVVNFLKIKIIGRSKFKCVSCIEKIPPIPR